MDRSVFEAPIGGHGVRFYSGYSSRVADSSGVNPVRIRPSKKPDPDITVKKPRSGYDRQKKKLYQNPSPTKHLLLIYFVVKFNIVNILILYYDFNQ